MQIKKKTTKEKVDKIELVVVLFCGQPREPEMFKKSINDFVLLKKENLVDEIIFSSEIRDVYPEIRSFLEDNGVVVIEREKPEIRGFGSIWCQMRTLDIGLSKIKPDKFVLKTRADVYINPDFLRKLFREKRELLKIKKSLPKGNIFKYKIWIPWCEITQPLYIGDECFFGLCDDLKHLVNYNDSYDKRNIGPGITHIRRFIHPFKDDYPIFLDSLGKYNIRKPLRNFIWKLSRRFFEKLKSIKLLKRISEKDKVNTLKNRLNDENFIKLLATYYSIIYSHFYIDGNSFPNQVIFGKHKRAIMDLDIINLENNFTIEMVKANPGGQIYCYDTKLIDNICEKKIKKTPFSEKLMRSIDDFNSLK